MVTFLTFLYTYSFLIGSSHMEKHRIKIRCLLAQETEIKFGCIKETYSENMSLAI